MAVDCKILEDTYVKQTYDNIAISFAQSRSEFLWLGVKNFIFSLPKDSLVLDAGCGNGKAMGKRNDLKYIGCDGSEQLVKICKEKGLHVTLEDIRKLSYETNTFDAVMCIAVLHHLADNDGRLCALNELVRVLKPGKQLLFQVWAKEQQLTDKFTPINDKNDYMVSWHRGKDKSEQRYYHLFPEKEIDELVKQLTNTKIKQKTYECDNWSFILEKV